MKSSPVNFTKPINCLVLSEQKFLIANNIRFYIDYAYVPIDK